MIVLPDSRSFAKDEAAPIRLLRFLAIVLRDGSAHARFIGPLGPGLRLSFGRLPRDLNGVLLTHEFLSQMLGVRRAGVTTVALTLQKAGFIEYNHGRVVVQHRSGLESVSCECYYAVDQQCKRITGSSVRKVDRGRRTDS